MNGVKKVRSGPKGSNHPPQLYKCSLSNQNLAVLAIILAYLKQLGQMKETGKVWLGAGAAALVSVLAAVGIFLVLGTTKIEGFQAVLEGMLKIVAVIMLTWMTIWMKQQGGNIGGELRRQIQVALSHGSV